MKFRLIPLFIIFMLLTACENSPITSLVPVVSGGESIPMAEQKNMDEIFQIEDKNTLIIELSTAISEKCAYGENIDALSSPEKVVYFCEWLQIEVNNGGFDQYFWNSAGDFAVEAVEALETIGATETKALLEEAISLFKGEYDSDRVKRQKALEHVDEQKFVQLDDKFYQYPDDLLELEYDFVIANKEEFK